MKKSPAITSPAVDVKALRESLELTQTQFAERYGVSLGRLRDWEQRRSEPDKVASAYFNFLFANPHFADRVSHGVGIQNAGITAKALESWSDSRASQDQMPVLVRKLLDGCIGVTSRSMPGGDAISYHGWDGIVESQVSTPWIPKGSSRWELSVRKDSRKKANEDYITRMSMSPEERAEITYIFVTSRNFPNKHEWVKEKRAKREWLDVRVYDSKDLEEWLETQPVAALWMAEKLGITGAGIESLDTFWVRWAHQSQPVITPMALLHGRDAGAELISKHVQENNALIQVTADSVDEAVTFTIAALMSDVDRNWVARAAVVTAPEGWRYIATNPGIELVLLAHPDLYETHTPNRRLSIIVPLSASVSSVSPNPARSIVVPRVLQSEFDVALRELGIDESDAERLARNTSRSWSVFRRLKAKTPQLARPGWLDKSNDTLEVVCLVGSWSSRSKGDRAVIEQITDCDYEKTERALRKLEQLDDAPVMRIDHVWMAKSPLELLHLVGPSLTDGELDRFFTVAKAVLEKPDPALSVAPEDRWRAAIYNQVREESGYVIDGICDSLVKLSAIGPSIDSLADRNIAARVNRLVAELLDGASAERWLSLSGVLRELAEASPSAFLAGVEDSLHMTDAPILRLLAESGTDSGLTGRCWHSDLLWALEILAWAPKYLARVVNILVKLDKQPVGGNWANTPVVTLLSLFRAWLPQTSVPVDTRIQMLDHLIKEDPDCGWKVLCELGLRRMDSATPNARPRWHDYDSGAGRGVTRVEFYTMSAATGERLIGMAKGNPERLGTLLESFDQFTDDQQESISKFVMDMIASDSGDDTLEVMRSSARNRLHWFLNYDENKPANAQLVDRLKHLYEALTPKGVLIRHSWIFSDRWPELPEVEAKRSNSADRVTELRKAAVKEIYAEEGFEGIKAFVRIVKDHFWLGRNIALLPLDRSALIDWIAAELPNINSDRAIRLTLAGIMDFPEPDMRREWIAALMERARSEGLKVADLSGFLTICGCDTTTWDFLGQQDSELYKCYWRAVPAPRWFQEPTDMNFVARELIAAGRPRSAFSVFDLSLENADTELVYEILERLSDTEEEGVPVPDGWHIAKAFDHIEEGGQIPEERIAVLEFRYARLLENTSRGIKSLNRAICNSPNLFADLVTVLHKTDHDPEANTQGSELLATQAWHVLRELHELPGQSDSSAMDHEKFMCWVDSARSLCLAADRGQSGDIRLGEWLAKGPVGTDGIRPCEELRPLLDDDGSANIRRGFFAGVLNSRGFTSRAYNEGGDQERELSQKFANDAAELQTHFPRLAETLHKLAGAYLEDARREDAEAELRIEGR